MTLSSGAEAPRPGGLTLPAPVAAVLRSGTATARFTGQVIDALAQQIPVAIKVFELGREPDRAVCYERFCKTLARDVAAAGLAATSVELTLDAALLQPGYVWDRRLHHLGPGCVNFVLDEQAVADAETMLQLWRLREQPSIRLAFWPLTSSACPLLTAERAMHVLPHFALQVPAQSAWLVASFDVHRFVEHSGGTDHDALRTALTQLIDAADAIHDGASWPTPAMQQDAWFNRRVAIRITGLDAVALHCNYDPHSHQTLARLRGLLTEIRNIMLQRSRTLARRAETLPAIAASSPCLGMGQGRLRNAWEQRWLRAVRSSATRHRNLLVLSPWAFFPAHNADPAYTNLLPLLSHADACDFRRKPSLSAWNSSEFNAFHSRAHAELRALHGDYVVAERL